MKINCSVEVLNRALPSLNITGKKAVRSSLTIGKSGNKGIFLLHQTNQNSLGTKYKVSNNIATVFTKFVNEGKATIRLKEPEHDLAIKCDPIQLKGFLRTLKLGLDGVPSLQMTTITSNNVQIKHIKPAKTKLKITSKEEYPVLEGFPRTLENLTINNAGQKVLDTRILRLRNLNVLNLESNDLTSLPEQLGGSLPNLAELYLSNNCLGHNKDWRWLVNPKLQKQLKLLDLRSNKISVLPDKMVKLNNVITLKLDNNSLQCLPIGVGCLRNLRYFSASNNQISYLPRSLFLLKLDSIDLSGNNFSSTSQRKLSFSDFQIVPSLVDLSASRVITKRLPYSPDTLPQTVIEYLESASFCTCDKACFSSRPETYFAFRDIRDRASLVVSSYNTVYTVAVRYCSFECYAKLNIFK